MFFAGSLLQNSQRRRVHRPTLGPCMNSKQLRRVPAHRSNACSRYEHARGGSLVRPRPLRLEVAVSCSPAPPPARSGSLVRPRPRGGSFGTKLAQKPHETATSAPEPHGIATSTQQAGPEAPPPARSGSLVQSRPPPARGGSLVRPDPRSGSLVRPRPRGGSFGTKLAQKPHGIATSTEKLHETATSAPEPHETATSAGKLLRIAAPAPGNRGQGCAGASSEPASSSYSACAWASSDSVEDANLVERKAL